MPSSLLETLQQAALKSSLPMPVLVHTGQPFPFSSYPLSPYAQLFLQNEQKLQQELHSQVQQVTSEVQQFPSMTGLSNVGVRSGSGGLFLLQVPHTKPDFTTIAQEFSLEKEQLEQAYAALQQRSFTTYLQFVTETLKQDMGTSSRFIEDTLDLQTAVESLTKRFHEHFGLLACVLQMNDMLIVHPKTSPFQETARQVAREVSPMLKKTGNMYVNTSLVSDLQFQQIPDVQDFGQGVVGFPLQHAQLILFPNNKLSDKELNAIQEALPEVNKVLDKAVQYAAKKTEANTDKLSGLFNRRYFFAEIDKRISQARKNKQPVSVVFVDLDGFKEYNDTHGHAAGDKLITLAAQTINTSLPSGGMAARYGGDEFVLYFSGVTSDKVIPLLEEMKTRLHDVLQMVSASMGLAISMNGTLRPDEQCNLADQALYKAKKAGRNRVEGFLSLDRNMAPIDLQETNG